MTMAQKSRQNSINGVAAWTTCQWQCHICLELSCRLFHIDSLCLSSFGNHCEGDQLSTVRPSPLKMTVRAIRCTDGTKQVHHSGVMGMSPDLSSLFLNENHAGLLSPCSVGDMSRREEGCSFKITVGVRYTHHCPSVFWMRSIEKGQVSKTRITVDLGPLSALHVIATDRDL